MPMPKLAANLSWIYQEVPFLQRFGAAAAHGFQAVEILFPYEAPAADIAAELKKHKLTQALFNLPPGDPSKGGRGVAALPGCEAEFSAALDTALDYAKALECRTLHVMSGIIAPVAVTRARYRSYIDAELKKHKLTQALFNLPPGDPSKGGRGVAALPGCEAEFSAALDTALDYAKALECRTLHVMSRMIAPRADTKAMHRTFIANL